MTLYDKQLYTETSNQMEPFHHWRQYRARGINAPCRVVPLLTALQKELLLPRRALEFEPAPQLWEQAFHMDTCHSPTLGKADAL